MSRVGKKEIVVPDGVDVVYNGQEVVIKGSKGELSLILRPEIELLVAKGAVKVLLRINNNNRVARAFQGLTRSLVANMVLGVTEGFKKSLEVNGIGYKVEVKDRCLVLNLGYSHEVNFDLPKGIDATVDRNIINLFGISKEKVGQVASSIRKLRPPEPYKGKGIKYVNERIYRKAGKTGVK